MQRAEQVIKNSIHRYFISNKDLDRILEFSVMKIEYGSNRKSNRNAT